METRESLKGINIEYHHNHGVNERDVKKVNHLISLIEGIRKREHPVKGDRIICVGPKGKIYAFSHLDRSYTHEFAAICTQAYVPFVSEDKREGRECPLLFSTSGGYWLSCTDRERYAWVNEDPYEKLFKCWGWCGPCGGGAIQFRAKVNSWIMYSKGIY